MEYKVLNKSLEIGCILSLDKKDIVINKKLTYQIFISYKELPGYQVIADDKGIIQGAPKFEVLNFEYNERRRDRHFKALNKIYLSN